MGTARTRVLTLVAGSFGTFVVLAAPASADVDCADLDVPGAAQSYYEGRSGDPDVLDADSDGRACEANDPAGHDRWTLLGLAAVLVGGLIRFSTDETRQLRRRTGAHGPDLLLTGAAVRVPRQWDGEDASLSGRRARLVTLGTTGTIEDLAGALRQVPYAERMDLLEQHAEHHGRAAQDVLDDLARDPQDLELQGWALAGYAPRATVRLLHCSCVGGLRNHFLHVDRVGERTWSCTGCLRIRADIGA